jgi:hypothetical protein
MRTLPDGRYVIAWDAPDPRDPRDRLIPHGTRWEGSIADAIASAAELFNRDGMIVWWKDNAFVHVDGRTLQEIMAKYVATPWLDGNTLRYVPLQSNSLIERALLNTQGTPREGALLPRLPRIYGPATEVRQRQQKVFVPPA